MSQISAKLIGRIKRTEMVESFRFAPEQKIDFIPGQFMQVIFDDKNSDNKELNKYLSFSSSPAREYIEFTKRLSGSVFSDKLRALKINDTILLKAPLGACVFKEEYKKIGFLIGGIGITPVISIIEYVMDNKLDTDISLVYSNRTDKDIAFKPELDRWQSMNRRLKILYVVSDCPPQDNICIYGKIDKELVTERAPDLKERVSFIFGPPKMVEAMNNLCLEFGCAKQNLKTESFVGY